MSNPPTHTLFSYRLLLWLTAPLILTFNTWQAFRAHDFRVFCHRLGLCLPRRKDGPLWLHAASVGEIMAAKPLIDSLRKSYPLTPIIVTTTTATGARLAAQRLPAEVQHFYLPVDWPGAVKRFLRAMQPSAVLIMETELWPNLFVTVANNNIPLIIINGRLSEKTLNAGSWVKKLYATSLRCVTAILTRSSEDAYAFERLGASHSQTLSIGNIKYATPTNRDPVAAINLGRPFILAASTHDDEEKQITAAWLDNQEHQQQKTLLVIAPRHPDRRENILRQLNKPGVNIAVRSRNDIVTNETQVYLADTLGELENFISGAEMVFMGGSLVPHGGHNILEPARLGKAIIFGPHMQNFNDEAVLLMTAQAARQVTDANELAKVFNGWLTNPDQTVQLGRHAQSVMEQQEDILYRYVESVAELCHLQKSNSNN